MTTSSIRSTGRRLITTLALALALVCMMWGTAPATGEFRARLSDTTPTSGAGSGDVAAEIQFGREVAARILAREGLYDNAELTKYVNLVAGALALFTDRPELEFHVAVLDTDDINAYAAPGGYIFITKGAIAEMQDEAELAAVIAHEMAHITRRHTVKELNIRGGDNSVVGGFARFMGAAGDPVKIGFMKLVDKAMEILYDRGYKAEDEREADDTAAMTLAFSGYEPEALVQYLDRVKAIKGEPTDILTRTHPGFDEREHRIQSIIAEEGLQGAQYKTGKDRFEAIKKTL
jgi:predicted Zn-dependent protease